VGKPAGLTAAVIALALTSITAFEGFRSVAVHDPIDPKGVNTVCYGYIDNVKVGDRYTKAQCEEMLKRDIPRYDAMVKKAIKVDMPPHRHAAILSFTYNVGGGALAKSSVARHLNNGDVRKGCDALLLYVYANGVKLRGLENRRKKEREWCLRSD
jgi:lysozyme